MKVKYMISVFCALHVAVAASAPSYKTPPSNAALLEQQKAVDTKIEDLLEQAKIVREAKEQYEREGKAQLAQDSQKELDELLKKLEALLKERGFVREEEGHPQDLEQSPYQP